MCACVGKEGENYTIKSLVNEYTHMSDVSQLSGEVDEHHSNDS